MRPRVTAMGPSLQWWQGEADRVLRAACKSAFGMDVKLTDLEGRQCEAPQALDDMPKISLPFLLNTQNGGVALFVLDGTLIDGLIEQQLLGEVMATKRLDRPITAIDAGLSEGFVRSALAGIGAEPDTLFAGLSVLRPEQDRAEVRLALGEGRYDILEAKIDMGPGIKTGSFELWVPPQPVAVVGQPPAGPNPAIMGILRDCEIELQTWLQGGRASAIDLLNMEVGSVLPLKKVALTAVKVTDASGHCLAEGRLGQLNGFRALRLSKLQLPQEVAGPASLNANPAPAIMSADAAAGATSSSDTDPEKEPEFIENS